MCHKMLLASVEEIKSGCGLMSSWLSTSAGVIHGNRQELTVIVRCGKGLQPFKVSILPQTQIQNSSISHIMEVSSGVDAANNIPLSVCNVKTKPSRF